MSNRRKPRSAGPDWPKQARYDIEFAKRILLDHGEVAPMFVLHDGIADPLVIAGAWENDDDKDRMAALLRCLCVAENVVAISFIGEAWVRQLSRAPGETDASMEERVNAVRPKDAEDRSEVILAEITWRDGADERHSLAEQREIVRGWDGKVTGVKALPAPWNSAEGSYSGRWVSVLPKHAPTPEERRQAHALLFELERSLGFKLKGAA